MMDLAARIQRLEDIEAIRHLKARWGETIDANLGSAKIVAMFAEDAVIDIERYGRHRGHAALEAFFSETRFTWMFHCLIPKVIEIAENGRTARGRWRLWELGTKPRSAPGDPGEPVWIGGDYDDDFVKIGGEWKFKTIRLKLAFLSPYDQGWVKKPFAD